MTARDQRYARIAKACLRAVNQSTGGKKNIEEDIQRVYEAIDDAFRTEFASLEKELIIAREGLKQVTQQQNLDAAQKCAQEALAGITYWNEDDAKH